MAATTPLSSPSIFDNSFCQLMECRYRKHCYRSLCPMCAAYTAAHAPTIEVARDMAAVVQRLHLCKEDPGESFEEIHRRIRAVTALREHVLRYGEMPLAGQARSM